MSARWWTFAVWALVAASALFWGLKLFVAAAPLAARTPVAAPATVARGDLTRLLGVDAPPPVVAAAPEPAPDARFQLIGVVSPRAAHSGGEGLALIAVDGKPAKAFRVGAVVDGQTVLQSVGARGAKLGPRGGPALVALDIAPPAAAATAALPSATGGNAVVAPQPRPLPGAPVSRRAVQPPMPAAPAGVPSQIQNQEDPPTR